MTYMRVLGEKITIREWAKGFYSIQINEKDFKSVISTLKPNNSVLESYIYKEINHFYLLEETERIFELAIRSDSQLYQLLKEKQTKEII